jgi:hypothetical protein
VYPCKVPAVLLCRWRCAFALPLPCLCPVFAVSLSCLALFLPCHGRGAVPLPWFCRAVALLLQCICRVCFVSCRVVAVVCCVCAVSLPWLCRVFAVVCRVFAVVLPCVCRGFAVCLPCRGRVSLLCVCPYCVFAVNLQCIVLVFSAGSQSRYRHRPPRAAIQANPGAHWQPESGFESPGDQPASLPKPIPATCCDELVHVACPAIWQGATNVCEERLSRHKRITSLAGPACVAPSSYCRNTKHR